MSKFFDTVRAMKKVLTKKNEKPKGYDVIATVTGVDGETAWVSIPSGVPETPAQVGVAVKQGDKVMVRVSGGRARVIGNVTSPPTDDTIAQEAHRQSILAYNEVKNVAEQVTVVDKKVVENAEQMAQTVIQINSDIEGLQEQIDGNITSWFYAVDPTLNNPPAIDWLEEGTEAVHLGDLYYNTETGYAWRWMYDGDEDEYGWMRITDVDVVKALADAAKAQDTADSKRRVFVAQPTPPYDVGDLWVQGSGGDILRSTAKRETGASYVAADWVKASKYTDDTVAQQALTSANGKNTVYHSATRPTGGTYKVGDTWFNSSEGYAIYTWNGSQWVKEELGSDALKDLAITNAKIADATIQSAKIAGLDVGKLTGGYIDAIHINARDFRVGDFVNDGTYLTEADQLTVDSIEYAYQLSTSGTAVPQGTWQTTPQAPTATQFAWTRTTTNYSDGTSAVTYTVGGKQGIQGETGDDGTTFTPSVDANGNISWTNDGGKTNPTTRNITGPQGDSVSITSTTTRYQSSSSGTSTPTGTWLTYIPSVSAGYYLWTRVIVNYSDGNSTTSYSVARQGENGVDVTSQYVTTISGRSGVCVHAANDTSNYGNFNSNGVTVYKGGVDVASFGETQRIGKLSSDTINLLVDTNQLRFRKNTDTLMVIGTNESTSYFASLLSELIISLPDDKPSISMKAPRNSSELGRVRIWNYGANDEGSVFELSENGTITISAEDANGNGKYVNMSGAGLNVVGPITQNANKAVIDKSMIQSGTTGGVTVAANTHVTKTVSFSFSSTPKVTCSIYSDSTYYSNVADVSVWASNVSSTGCTIHFYNKSSRQLQPAVHWIATLL